MTKSRNEGLVDLDTGRTIALESPAWPWASHGPAVIYVAADRSTICQIDGDQFDPTGLTGRDRALCIALLEHALDRLRGHQSAQAAASSDDGFGFAGGSGGLQERGWAAQANRPIDI